MGFGERFKSLREEKGLSQTQIMREIGTSKSTVSAWERGVRKPEFSMLERLCEYFNVSMGYLLGQSNERGSASNNPEVTLRDVIDEDADLIRNISKKVARLSYRSKLIAKATVEALLKQDEIEESARPDGAVDVELKY